MNKDNRDLLESLINNRLKEALKSESEDNKAFEEAMKAIDRQLEIDKKEFEMYKEEMKLKYDKEKEDIKQKFELLKEDNRQQFEINKEDKRQHFELEKQVIQNNSDCKRAADDRDHQMTLECMKQKFKLKELNINNKLEEAKMKLEADQAAKDRLIKCGEIALAVVVTPMIEAGCKKAFAKMICDFEKDYNFTTMAGKSLSGIFKFRK